MKKKSFFYQVFLINIIISLIAMSIVSVVVLSQNLGRTKEILFSNCQNLASSLAENFIVYDALVSKRATQDLIVYLDTIVKNSTTIDSITIIDNNRICLYHYDRILTGAEIPILPNTDESVQTGIVEIGLDKNNKPIKQLCAFVPIKTESGIIYGYAIVGLFLKTLSKLNKSYISRYFLIILALIITTYLTSYYIVSRIRKSLLGHEPESFAGMLLRRNEVLDNLEEGLLSIDLDGFITLCTTSACKFFNLENKNYEGKKLEELNICNDLLTVLQTQTAQYNVQKISGKNKLLVNFIPMKENNQVIGAIAIIRNHTESIKMAEEMTGFRFVVEALRSNMHNFKNELHVILGMLQLGETKLAINYITHFNSLQTSQSSIIKDIQNKTIAALILGKTNEAKEQGIDLFLEPYSSLPLSNAYLSTSQLTIILGNLLENSIEATKNKSENGQINLFIKADEDGLKINVDDNGCGIPSENISKIFSRGFTTKSKNFANHGIGLYNINEIIKGRDGIIQLDSSPDEGTSISIQVNKRRLGYDK